MKRWRTRLLMLLLAAGILGAIIYAFMPVPVEVELAQVGRGPMQVTVDEDGQTRVRERYVIHAPLSGLLLRVPWDAGDSVQEGQTLAVIQPPDPQLLDIRTRTQAEARVQASEAAVQQAQAELRRAEAELELARSERQRISQLFEHAAATRKELDDAILLERVRQQTRQAAQDALDVARFELEQARAALLHVQMPGDASATQEQEAFIIPSPIAGQILRVIQESATAVNAGDPLLELGDTSALEVVVDVLSDDAVGVQPGNAVLLEGWGGDQPLNGQVRLVEPFAFTKISALGVEEQRANIIIDFTDPYEVWSSLGDGYRVDARIVVWQGDDVLKVPASALFRWGQDWAVFVVENGRAALRRVQVGQQNPREAQILDGLQEGERVIAYPGDRVEPGVRVTAAQETATRQ